MDARLAAIRTRVARTGEATEDDLGLIDEILEREGPSVEALVLRGQLMQLFGEDDPEALDEALACFEEAIEVDPRSAEAHEELAHFLDDVADRPEEAEAFFRRALELGAGDSAREGLRDVLSQLGRDDVPADA